MGELKRTLPLRQGGSGRVKIGRAIVTWGPRMYGVDKIVANAPMDAIDDLAAAIIEAKAQIDAAQIDTPKWCDE